MRSLNIKKSYTFGGKTQTAPPRIGCIEATLQEIDSTVFEDYDLLKSFSLGGTTFHHNYSYKLKNLPSYVDGAGYDRAYLGSF